MTMTEGFLHGASELQAALDMINKLEGRIFAPAFVLTVYHDDCQFECVKVRVYDCPGLHAILQEFQQEFNAATLPLRKALDERLRRFASEKALSIRDDCTTGHRKEPNR